MMATLEERRQMGRSSFASRPKVAPYSSTPASPRSSASSSSPRLPRPSTAPSRTSATPASSSRDPGTVQRWSVDEEAEEEPTGGSTFSRRSAASALETLTHRAADLAQELYRLKAQGAFTKQESSPRITPRKSTPRSSPRTKKASSTAPLRSSAAAPTTSPVASGQDVSCQVPDRTDPAGMPVWATLSEEASQATERATMLNDKVKAETATRAVCASPLDDHRAQRRHTAKQHTTKQRTASAPASALSVSLAPAAHTRATASALTSRPRLPRSQAQYELHEQQQLCDQQRLELDSYRGRAAAYKAAAAAAVAAGSAWSVEDEIRFAALQKQGEEARHSEGLRELLDLATVATARRVMDAARDVAHNRCASSTRAASTASSPLLSAPLRSSPLLSAPLRSSPRPHAATC